MTISLCTVITDLDFSSFVCDIKNFDSRWYLYSVSFEHNIP